MKVKTITENTRDEFDAAINSFGADHNVKFTQTHHTPLPTPAGYVMMYSATLFYCE